MCLIWPEWAKGRPDRQDTGKEGSSQNINMYVLPKLEVSLTLTIGGVDLNLTFNCEIVCFYMYAVNKQAQSFLSAQQ